MRGKGFTIIELMIVVSIIGILAAIAIPNYQKYQERQRGEDQIAAGLQKPISDSWLVEMRNPSSVEGLLGTFRNGSRCHTLQGDLAQVVGRDGDRVLVRYVATVKPEEGSCPSGALFFMTVSDFCALDADVPQQEDDTSVVTRLLGEEAKTR